MQARWRLGGDRMETGGAPPPSPGGPHGRPGIGGRESFSLDSRRGNPVEVEPSPTALADPALAIVGRSPRMPHIERSL